MTKSDRITAYRLFMPDTINLPALEELGFFDAPASCKRHGAYEGGLFDHSLEVAKYLVYLTEKLNLKWKSELSPYVIGMFHDLCKCDFYEKNTDGTYSIKSDLIIPGHGERSVMMIQSSIMEITDEELACIRWHMGAFETDTRLWVNYHNAVKKYPNVLFTHTADMYAAKVLGV